ncbi:MAG TPA: ATP-binding protein, partial [Opitutales bacterium]|nr:ATP-binding protein [Opitutales bacterium]
WQHMADTYAEFGMLPRDFTYDGFLYDPNPKPNYAPLYWTLAIVSGIAVAALVWILPLYRLNLRLRENLAREHALLLELRTAKDAAEAADAAKSRYLAVITHEVRTPLSGLISIAELLQDERHETERSQMLSIMRSTGEEMLKLINDVLEFSKIEAGRLHLDQNLMEVAPLLEDLHRLFSASAKEKSVEFKVQVAPETPLIIITDVRRLRQILGNLLSNALKFTEKGRVTLGVSTRPDPADGVGEKNWRWRFAVRDTGIGISPEQAAALFSPYTQAHPGIEQRFGGTGLGLAISHQLARLLGGELSLEHSTPGEGSTFVLEIVTPDAETAKNME